MTTDLMIIIVLGLIVLLVEIYNSNHRAMIDNKIEEMHAWMRRNNPYKYTQTDKDTQIEFRNNQQNQISK